MWIKINNLYNYDYYKTFNYFVFNYFVRIMDSNKYCYFKDGKGNFNIQSIYWPEKVKILPGWDRKIYYICG